MHARINSGVRVQAGVTVATIIHGVAVPTGRTGTPRVPNPSMNEIPATTTTIRAHVPQVFGLNLLRPVLALASTIIGKMQHAKEHTVVALTVQNQPPGPVRGLVRELAVRARVATAGKMREEHSTAATMTGGDHGDRLPGRLQGPLRDPGAGQ